MGHRLAFPERGLVAGVRGLLALVLLPPLAMAPETVYPYTVGRALYARGLIAVAFARWAVLAVHRPAWRPPRSALLLLLGLWLAACVVAAVFGVSPRRSVWSYYERMQGRSTRRTGWCSRSWPGRRFRRIRSPTPWATIRRLRAAARSSGRSPSQPSEKDDTWLVGLRRSLASSFSENDDFIIW